MFNCEGLRQVQNWFWKLINATQLYEAVAMSLYNIFSSLVDEGVTYIIVHPMES